MQRTQELGQGSFGEVWLEKCISGPDSGQVRAVRRLRKDVSASVSCVHELEAIAKFSQQRYRDHFVQSFGWFDDHSTIYITMKYVQLGDLERFLGAPLLESEARAIAEQLLESLVFMHDNRFAHRDLMPNNILVLHKGPEWWVKVADFGISNRVGATALRTHVGTEAYLAPEVRGFMAAGSDAEDTFSFAVDIWARVGMKVGLVGTGGH